MESNLQLVDDLKSKSQLTEQVTSIKINNGVFQ